VEFLRFGNIQPPLCFSLQAVGDNRQETDGGEINPQVKPMKIPVLEIAKRINHY